MTTTKHNTTFVINALTRDNCPSDAFFSAATQLLVDFTAEWEWDRGCASEGDFGGFTLRSVEITDLTVIVEILGNELAVPFDLRELDTEVGKVIDKCLARQCFERVADSGAANRF